MAVIEDVKAVLREVLQLGDRARHLNADTALLGGLPELDSMAVVAVITGLEERFDITVADDEISADTFETVGTLCKFIERKRAT